MGDLLEPVGGAEEAPGAAFETDSTAVGIALDRARSRRGKGEAKSGDDAADQLLEDQRGLIADQRHHLREQFRHLGLKLWSERLKLTLQGLTLLVGLMALIAVGALAWQAHEADGVVIEAFAVPPDLAARGYSGQALASRVQDRLNRMQELTLPVRPAATYSNDWGHDIKVEIPETGVSIGELQRGLRTWLGHESHVGGDLVRTPDGLSLTVRTEEGGDEVTGADADMGGLAQKAAEALYRRTQPYRYGLYLVGAGRTSESVAVWTELAASGPPAERPWALAALARSEANPVRAQELARQAITLNPNLAEPWIVLSSASQARGDYEGAYQGLKQSLVRMAAPDQGGFAGDSLMRANIQGNYDTYSGDFSGCLKEGLEARRLAVKPWVVATAESRIQYCLGLVHETTAARQRGGGLSDAELLLRAGPRGSYSWGAETNLNVVWTDDDFAAALRQLEGVEGVLADSPLAAGYLSARLYPLKAIMLAQLGRLDEARALAAAFPPNCYWCVGAQAFIAEAAHDPAEADRLYGQIARMAPSVAWNYAWWALAKLRRGDDDGAIAVALRGLKPNPRYADLYEIWGAALLHKGDAKGAVAQFEKAGALTPRWGRLHLKWGEALAKLGKADEARAHFRAAAGMDLGGADRAELAAQKV